MAIMTFAVVEKQPKAVKKDKVNTEPHQPSKTKPKVKHYSTLDAIIVYKRGQCFVEIDEVVYPLTRASSTLVGKHSFWAEQLDEDNVSKLRIQTAICPVNQFPHPHKYRYKDGEEVKGYLTVYNEFHVTQGSNQRFSDRKPRTGF